MKSEIGALARRHPDPPVESTEDLSNRHVVAVAFHLAAFTTSHAVTEYKEEQEIKKKKLLGIE